MYVDASIYFICLTIRMYTFMQWELKVWNEEKAMCSLSNEKKTKIFLVYYLEGLDHNT